ncbi:hypothetical protein NPS53_08815 [Pseudomonas putida]|uniref:hypothetical protein n=1 Tax=Pseudomonas putida TaxID=303 RepID=UPI0023647532|nr:hypothetical protein [Pseudomonas putida]MDD2139675.1 hypothetical protein [Pseudomonas putida]HDS1721599.1 hypothetical protein [Pseudomonas putida]
MTTNRDFAQLVLGTEAPSLEKRENVVRNGLQDWRYESGYIRVHAVKATSKTTVYAAVSYVSKGERFLTYAAVSLSCRRKDDGHWLAAEAFLANATVPFSMTDCPDEIFEVGKATGFSAQVDGSWYSSCIQSRKVRLNTQALKKGQIFKLDDNCPSMLIAGERATYAVVTSKKNARFIAPTVRRTKDASTVELLENYSPVPGQGVPSFTALHGYTEIGELVFDLSGATPALKGRMVAGAKAELIKRAKADLDRKLRSAFDQFDFASKFTSGAWLS